LRWRHELFQRPHQLALELARRGYLVFFLEGVWPRPGEGGFARVDDRLYTATVRLETFSVLDAPLVFFLSYNALDVACLRRPRTIYELIDELEVFRGDTADIRRTHEKLLASAGVVVATARRLHAHVRTRRRDAILCPNAVDYEHFRHAATPGPLPSDLTALLRPGHPVVGYYGALASWLDYELIRFAARQRPELEFVLIGPDYDGSLARTDVVDLPNVHRLDSRPYAELPGYLRAFDVATIPFVVNDVTESTSPIKLFEYMAARKPVVTTAMGECRRYDGVWIAEDGEQFVSLVDRAVASRGDVAHLDRLEAIARDNTWHARVGQILDAIDARFAASDAASRLVARQAVP
jgi:glycosyltransferase involved in cell wall biosynthesis